MTCKEANPSESCPEKRTILVADDQDMTRNVLVRMLQKIGFDTLSVADGEAAVSLFERERERICVCILDHLMPKMNGVEAYRKIRALDHGIKIILASGLAESDLGVEDEIGGINAILHKPYTRKLLAETLQSILAES